jgi:hypothetical protein
LLGLNSLTINGALVFCLRQIIDLIGFVLSQTEAHIVDKLRDTEVKFAVTFGKEVFNQCGRKTSQETTFVICYNVFEILSDKARFEVGQVKSAVIVDGVLVNHI